MRFLEQARQARQRAGEQRLQEVAAAAENARLRAELERLQTERIRGAAEEAALELLAASKLYPAEQRAFVDLYCVLANDDAERPLDGSPSRVALLLDDYLARPPHQLDQDLVPMRWGPRAGADGPELAAAEEAARRYAARKKPAPEA